MTMNGRTEDAELRCEKVWKYVGRLITVSFAIAFVPFAIVFALGPNRNLLAFWIGLFVILELGLYLFMGPLYRPTVISVLVQHDALLIRNRDGTEARIRFSDIKRISSGYAASIVIGKSGDRHPLGFGFGGAQGDVILKSYRKWAEAKRIKLLESESRGRVTSHLGKNLETLD